MYTCNIQLCKPLYIVYGSFTLHKMLFLGSRGLSQKYEKCKPGNV